MPLDYDIDTERRRITLNATGTLTDEELIECIKRVRADPNNAPDMTTLADLDTVRRLELTGEGINRMLDVVRATGRPEGRAKLAVLTTRETDFYIARLIQALAEAEDTPLRFHAFTDREEAEKWLGEA